MRKDTAGTLIDGSTAVRPAVANLCTVLNGFGSHNKQ